MVNNSVAAEKSFGKGKWQAGQKQQ